MDANTTSTRNIPYISLLFALGICVFASDIYLSFTLRAWGFIGMLLAIVVYCIATGFVELLGNSNYQQKSKQIVKEFALTIWFASFSVDYWKGGNKAITMLNVSAAIMFLIFTVRAVADLNRIKKSQAHRARLKSVTQI